MQEALFKAIRYFGSQALLAKAIGISQQMVSHWLARDSIPYISAVKIAYLSKGHVSLDELAPHQKDLNHLFKIGIAHQHEDTNMPRIRCTKPEFFKHPDIFDAEIKYQLPMRVAFQALWSCCDRKGRFRWKPRQLKLDMLPYDDLDLEEVLNVLVIEKFIVKYEVNGECYGCIPSWENHQHINNREPESTLPDISEGKIITLKELSEADTHHSCTCNTYPSRKARVSNAQVTGDGCVMNTPPEIVIEKNNLSDDGVVTSQNNSSINNSLEHHKQNLNNELTTRESRVIDASVQNLSMHQRKGKGREREKEIEREEKIYTSNDLVAHKARRVCELEDHEFIFNHWKAVMNHPNAQLDDKRKKIIRNALQAGYTKTELCDAISGCAKTPYNMGSNDTGQRFDGLQVILRDADQIDRFIRNHQQPPLAGNSERSRNNTHALKNWLIKKSHTIAEGEVYEN